MKPKTVKEVMNGWSKIAKRGTWSFEPATIQAIAREILGAVKGEIEDDSSLDGHLLYEKLDEIIKSL